MGEIDAAVLAGRLTWSELALALGVPRTSAHSARERARTIAAELRTHGLLPRSSVAAGPPPTPLAPPTSPAPVPPSASRPASAERVPAVPASRPFRAAVYGPTPPGTKGADGAEEGVGGEEPVGAALRRMIEHGSG